MPAVLVAHFDGASRGNPGQAGIGAVLLNPETGEILWEMSRSIGRRTNNEAEYLALIELLKHLSENAIRNVVIRGDSQLVVHQVNGDWRVKEPHLWPLCAQAQSLFQEVDAARLEWVPREKNQYADRLSNKAFSDKKQAEQHVFDPKRLERITDTIYVAHGTRDYAIDIASRVCTCPAFQRSKNCKHLIALEGVVSQDVLVQNM